MVEFVVDAENVIEPIDDKTFQIRLAKSFCCVLKSFTLPGMTGGVVYPKEITELDATKDVGVENYIGTGPYKLKKWDVGHKVVLERFEDYIPRSEPGSFLAGAQISYFDEIELLEIPAEETKIAGLKTGEWDVVDDPDVPTVHFGQFFGIVPHSDKVRNLTPRIYTAFTNAYFAE